MSIDWSRKDARITADTGGVGGGARALRRYGIVIPAGASFGSVTLPDGRLFAYADYGPPSGIPILYCHGFPSCSLEAGLLAPVLAAEGARIIAPDRPGYGRSSPLKGRTLRSFADDVAVLLDTLGLGSVAVVGVSGGGPYALSLLAHMPQRVTRGALVGALGPPEALRACRDDLFPLVRGALHLADLGPVLAPLVAWPVTRFLRLRGRLRLGARLASAADREVLADPAVLDVLVAAQYEGMRRGAQAAVQDLLLYVRPWDFSLAEISSECALWQGAADRIVPARMALEIAALLPRARPHLIEGEGHYSLPIRYRTTIIRDVIGQGGRS
ncbi:MAG: alpha/beta fold hydrolase [Acidiferrobacter sp.]